MTRAPRSRTPWLRLLPIAIAALAFPSASAELTGGGQTTDVVRMLGVRLDMPGDSLVSPQGAPIASSLPFHITSDASNVLTLLRYDWSSTQAYYGNAPAQRFITIGGTTTFIHDLLWFRQENSTPVHAATLSDFYSPLVLNNSGASSRSTFTTAGNACSGWTGTAAPGFSPAAAGQFTFKYHLASSPANDAPATSPTYHYCADTTNQQAYVSTSTTYASQNLIVSYAQNSALGSLKSYHVEILAGQSKGNRYCLNGFLGTGTAAAPILVQCQRLPYETSGASTVKQWVLFDPPERFPSSNQLGSSNAISFIPTGTQWNPYSHTTTNSA